MSSTGMTPEQRQMAARVAAHSKWAKTRDRTAATEPARQGFRDKLARELDPDGSMTTAEREVAVEAALRAHYQRMALRSSQARAARRPVTNPQM